MTETVQVALITLAASFIGATIGAISTYYVTKRSNEFESRKFLYEKKLSAYSTFLREYSLFFEKLTNSDTIPAIEDKVNFETASYVATIIAPDNLAELILSSANEFANAFEKEPVDLDLVDRHTFKIHRAMADDLENTRPK